MEIFNIIGIRETRTFASTRTRITLRGHVPPRARPGVPARERHRGIVAQIAAGADLRQERAKIEVTESQCDDLAFAELRLGGALTKQRRNLGVEFQGQLFTAGHALSLSAPCDSPRCARIPGGNPRAKLGNASGESDAVRIASEEAIYVTSYTSPAGGEASGRHTGINRPSQWRCRSWISAKNPMEQAATSRDWPQQAEAHRRSRVTYIGRAGNSS